MIRALLVVSFVAVAVGGCRCRRDVEAHRPDDETKSIVHDAAPAPPPIDPRFVLLRGDLVDLDARTAATWFTTPPRAWASDARGLTVIEDGGVWEFEPPASGYRWKSAASPAVGAAKTIVASDPWIVGVWEHNVARFDRATGARTLLLPGAGATFEDAVGLRDAAFVLDASGTLTVVELATGSIRATVAPTGAAPSPYVELATFDALGLVCRLVRDADWLVDCIEPSGKVRWAKSFPPPPGGPAGCMSARTPSAHHLIFSGRWSGTCGTIVVRAEDGSTALAWGDDASAVLETAKGAFEGVLAVPSGAASGTDVTATDATGSRNWTATIGGYGEDLAVVSKSGLLVVARWDMISTGSLLVAIDPTSRRVAWVADVEQLSIPHSKYHNEVELRARGDDVVMIGRESGGSYVQIFDAASGARRYSHLIK